MDKNQLHKVFSKPFDQEEWIALLKSVFGARQLLVQPKPIVLANKNKAQAAFELGSFTTSDDRVIGLYKVEVNPDVWLERNKVGLRELLRNVYKYDVDGALIVFEQDKKWRLSFVSEIKVLNEEGEVIKQATEPKRYTYLFGNKEKVLTPSLRLSRLTGKALTLEDIRSAFSVEALNEEFYKTIADQFYQLIGGTMGKSKKAKTYDGALKLPSLPKNNRQIYQEFAVRLIGRTVFCWFLKVKKSDKGEPLLPEDLLSLGAVKSNSNYYHTILEPLFFQTLNTPMEKRLKGLPKGCENVPFLNGGLFEYGADDFYKPNKQTGLSENINTLVIPDEWFLSFFSELEKYNFTIDENSVVDVEVSVDPEMLGRIFENLLAEIDPDSGETARKATGSFYTPREIVDYMATESLLQYLHNKTGLEQDQLRPVFMMTEEKTPEFNAQEREAILDALDKVKILDPACGSGAFPMGVLQKIVMVLQKLDPESEWWIKRQIDRIENALLKKQIEEKLGDVSVEYARKIGIIQNSLFGVDIQPIAAEISKLRCFLTLIVDENIDESKGNRGIEPLPNLEFKFVTADTLLKLPEELDFGGIFNSNDDLESLKKLRTKYLQSYGEQKEGIKIEFKKVQDQIYKQQISLGKNVDVNSRAYLISTWNPFGHDKVDWFDSEWMFGVNSFDIVIGNPPYVEFKNLSTTIKKNLINYETTKGKYDLYIAFMERPNAFLVEKGILCFINPTRFMHRDYGFEIRKYINREYKVIQIIDFGDSQIFNTATTYTGIFIFEKGICSNYDFTYSRNINRLKFQTVSDSKLTPEPWYFQSNSIEFILNKIRKDTVSLEDIVDGIFQGIATGKDSVFVIKEREIEELGLETDSIKKFLMGKDIQPYKINWSKHYVIYPYEDNGRVLNEKLLKQKYPNIYHYLTKRRSDLEGREYFEKSKKLWFELWNQRSFQKFKGEKIITLDNASKNSFAFDKDGFIGTTTTYSIVPRKEISIFGLLGLLNSSLMTFYHKKNTIPQANGFYRYQRTFIKSFPIKKIENNMEFFNSIGIISSMITSLTYAKEKINNHVPNFHIIQLFEDVIDAVVMEMYFKEDFENAGITFIPYVIRDFAFPESNGNKLDIIHQSYQRLREKDNEIINNLKLMDIKLADIVGPIKTAR